MPIYESDEITRDDLEKLRHTNDCLECSGWLDVFYDFDTHRAFLACRDWRRTHHNGMTREPSRYEAGGMGELTIERRREIMGNEHGNEKTKALGKYLGGVQTMTRAIATEIVNTLWPGAPQVEKTKCILLCETYQLNPLLRHIHLVGYKRNKNGRPVLDDQGKPVFDWSIQLGIGATRLMAQRNHSYSYVDFTPRKATTAEINKILGDTADPHALYGFCHIKDMKTGAEAFGLRGIDRQANIKGTEKGNTHLNMACIRAERQALDRQYPGEMPTGFEVVDERFMEDIDGIGEVDKSTGEILKPAGEVIESTAEVLPDETPMQEELGTCPIHNVPLLPGKGKFPAYCPTRIDGTGRSAGKTVWCKGKALDTEVAQQEILGPPTSAGEAKPQRDPDTLKSINDLFKACNEDFKLQPADVVKELGYNSQTDISDTPALCYQKIKSVR